MLFDPRWNQHTFLDQWIEWLETKDPSERYEWRHPATCACGQFYGGKGWLGLQRFTLLNNIARGDGWKHDSADWTFGKCLERAKQVREWERLGDPRPCQ